MLPITIRHTKQNHYAPSCVAARSLRQYSIKIRITRSPRFTTTRSSNIKFEFKFTQQLYILNDVVCATFRARCRRRRGKAPHAEYAFDKSFVEIEEEEDEGKVLSSYLVDAEWFGGLCGMDKLCYTRE